MSGRRPGIRLRTRIAAVTGVAAFLVLAGTGAGYAAWKATSTVSATATSTNAAVTLAIDPALAGAYTSSALTRIAPLTLANTGGAPLSLAVTATNTNASLAGQIRLQLWVRTGGTCGTTVPGSGVTTGTLAAPPALPTGATTLANGSNVVVCAATTFIGTYATYSGQSNTATLTLTGTVGTAWSSTASGTLAQNLSAPTATCVNKGDLEVTVTWNQPAALPSTAHPAGYFISVTRAGTTIQLDNVLWAYAPRTADLHPSKFASANWPTGVYQATLWWSPNINAGFANATKTAFATVDLNFQPAGGWYTLRCA